jgi:hypothetical protein
MRKYIIPGEEIESEVLHIRNCSWLFVESIDAFRVVLRSSSDQMASYRYDQVFHATQRGYYG